MSDRELVGMTMGARKRAARHAVYPEETRRVAQIAFHEGWNWTASRASDYAAERYAYRVGQRLRPCRGCRGCQPPCERCDRPRPAPETPCTCYRFWEAPPCGGTGVRPAWSTRR